MVSPTADLRLPVRARRYWRAAPTPLVVSAVLVASGFALPFVHLIARDLDGDLIATLREEHIGGPLGRTLALAVTTSFTTAIIGTTLAWLLVRTDMPGRRWLRKLAPLPLVFPSFVGAFCFLAAFTEGGLLERYVLAPLGVEDLWRIEGFGWAVLVLTLFTYPYVYLPVVARLAALPPSIEESARALGRTPRQTFTAVVLPQTVGAIGAGALLVFLYSLSEFGAVALLRYDTLTRSIYASTRSFDSRAAFASSLVLGLCAILVIGAERRWAARRARTEALGAGRAVIVYQLGRAKAGAIAFVALIGTMALFGPLAVLVQWALRGMANGSTLHAERLLPATRTTAMYGIVGACIAVAVVLPVAYLSVRHPHARIARLTTSIVSSTFAFPGLIIGFAFVSLAQNSWVPEQLYLSTQLLVVAYVVHFGAQALRASEVAVGGVPRRIGDAARALGANGWRRFFRVELPLMRSGLAAGGGLVMLSIMKELPATLLLIPNDTDTLARRIWFATEDLFYAQAGVFALVLLVLSGVLTWLLTIRPLERDGRV